MALAPAVGKRLAAGSFPVSLDGLEPLFARVLGHSEPPGSSRFWGSVQLAWLYKVEIRVCPLPLPWPEDDTLYTDFSTLFVTATLIRLEAAPHLVDQAYDALLAAISSGALAPGLRITQEDLAARLAVSRQPVLQALRLLKQQGLVLDAPGRGLMVAPLDAAALAQTYQVRGALDALAARLAAQRGVALPAAVLRDGRRSTRNGDVQAMIEADVNFHRALYAASGNPFIEGSALSHWCHIRRAMGAVLQSSIKRRPVWDEHQAIADAIAQGDPETAARAASAHAQQAGEHLAGQLGRQLAQPGAPQGATR